LTSEYTNRQPHERGEEHPQQDAGQTQSARERCNGVNTISGFEPITTKVLCSLAEFLSVANPCSRHDDYARASQVCTPAEINIVANELNFV
jgi:hypothetical protein